MISINDPVFSTTEDQMPIQLDGIRGNENVFAALRNLLTSILTEEEAYVATETLEGQFGTVNAVFAASDYALSALAGLSHDLIDCLRRMQSLFIALDGEAFRPGMRIETDKQAARFLRKQIGWQCRRFLYVIYVTPDLEIIAHEPLCSGSERDIEVYPREVVKRALAWHATGIILGRNYPDGKLGPWQVDIEDDERIAEACDLLGIDFLDSLIVTWHSVISMREARVREDQEAA